MPLRSRPVANKIRLQKLVYADIRTTFGLSAQMTVRAIGKVVEVYKRDKAIQPTFRPHGAIVYDPRILSWKGMDRVSILTLQSRILVPVTMGAYQTQRLRRVRGQADLIDREGQFYLAVVVEVPAPPPLRTARPTPGVPSTALTAPCQTAPTVAKDRHQIGQTLAQEASSSGTTLCHEREPPHCQTVGDAGPRYEARHRHHRRLFIKSLKYGIREFVTDGLHSEPYLCAKHARVVTNDSKCATIGGSDHHLLVYRRVTRRFGPKLRDGRRWQRVPIGHTRDRGGDDAPPLFGGQSIN